MKFTEQQQRTLRAAIDRIIPPDDYPGAWDAGVGDYLARQLDRELSTSVELYRQGLSCLEAEAGLRYQSTFGELSDDEKDLILSQVEQGDVRAPWTISSQYFFRLLVETTVEGFYSDPEQGGNRGRVSWLMTEFENP